MKKSKKISHNNRAVFTVVFVLFFLYAAGLLIPFLYGFNISLMENGRAFMRNPVGFPIPPHFSNYAESFKTLKIGETNFILMILNSLWYAGGSTFCTLAASTLVAYVVSKYKFKGRNFIYGLTLVVLMIPIYGSLPAQYRLYTRVGMVDSPLILLSAFSGFGIYFIYIHAFFKSISWSYAEAAFIDGPIIWLPNMPTIASGLYTYEFNMRYTANQPVYFAGVIISIIPALALFIVFQNTIMSNVYAGGLKG